MEFMGIPVYMNRNLILDLYSTLISGYVESKEDLFLKTRDNFAKFQIDNKTSKGRDSKKTDPEDKNNVIGNSCSDVLDYYGNVENRNGRRVQTRLKKSFTTFTIYNSLRKIMYSKKMIKSCDEVEFDNIISGDFIEINTIMPPTSLESQIYSVISLIEAYDTKLLNKLLPYDDPKYTITNFDFIYKELKVLLELLNKNNTNYIVVQNNKFKVVLNVNLNYFMDKNYYVYDNVNCCFKVMCQVTKKIGNGEYLNLLDKTCIPDYYMEILNLTRSYLDILKKYDIIIPQGFSCLVEYPAIKAVAIAMYI
ncbi:MAG: hypothetical protein N2448_09490 [Caloramator sp.]|nr:hypothetical protein [Caloramator sp.]